jgi:hypothetical protein
LQRIAEDDSLAAVAIIPQSDAMEDGDLLDGQEDEDGEEVTTIETTSEVVTDDDA